MPKFQKYLRHIDLLVTPFEFNVNKNQKSLTKQGGFFSITILILMIIYTISIFISTISKQTSIYTGTQTQSIQDYLDQNSSLFILQLSQPKSGDIITYDSVLTSFFTLNIQYVHQVRPENSTQYYRNNTKLNYRECTQALIDKFNFFKQYPTQEQAQRYLCFEGNYNLSGSFFDSVYDYVKISVEKCEGDPKWKSTEELENFIEKGVDVNLFILDSKIKQTLNMTEPSKESAYVIFWKLTTGIANSEDLFLQPIVIDLVNNQNIFSLLSGKSETRTRIFSSSRVEKSDRRYYSKNVATSYNLCTFYLRISPNSQNFFASQAQGFASFFGCFILSIRSRHSDFRVCQNLYKIYIEHETYIKVMNQVYKFDLRENIERKNNQTITETLTDEKVKSLDQVNNKQNVQLLWYLQILLQEKFLKKCNDGKDSKIKNNDRFRTFKYCKKIYEIDCLKLLLFNDEQLNSLIALLSQIIKIGEKNFLANKNQAIFSREIFVKKQQFGSGRVILMLRKYSSFKFQIEMQLSKLSRFFKAQIKAKSVEELLQVYSKILSGQNSNQRMNEHILNFLKYNQILFSIVDATHKKNLQDQEKKKIQGKLTQKGHRTLTLDALLTIMFSKQLMKIKNHLRTYIQLQNYHLNRLVIFVVIKEIKRLKQTILMKFMKIRQISNQYRNLKGIMIILNILNLIKLQIKSQTYFYIIQKEMLNQQANLNEINIMSFYIIVSFRK